MLKEESLQMQNQMVGNGENKNKCIKNIPILAETNKKIIHKNEMDLNELEKQKKSLETIFEADEKVVKVCTLSSPHFSDVKNSFSNF